MTPTQSDIEHIRDLSEHAARRSDAYRGTDGWRQREAWRDAWAQLRAGALALELALASEDEGSGPTIWRSDTAAISIDMKGVLK